MIVLLYRKRHVRTGNYKQPSRLLSGFWVRLSSKCIISRKSIIGVTTGFFFFYLFISFSATCSEPADVRIIVE